ncbi:MAG: hypothetical protein U9O89_02080, partial [Thermoproteota archaeon]|nr:hypothetical protein [Thermoproteota archaeon]
QVVCPECGKIGSLRKIHNKKRGDKFIIVYHGMKGGRNGKRIECYIRKGDYPDFYCKHYPEALTNWVFQINNTHASVVKYACS